MHLAAIVRFVSAPQWAFSAYGPPRLPVGQQKANLWTVKSQPWGNKNPTWFPGRIILFGGAKGIRTPDLLIANETRYQLRHSPMGGFSLAQRAARVNSASHALAAYSPAACLFTRRATPLQDSIEVDRLEVSSHRLHIQRHVSRRGGGTYRVNHAGYFLG